MCREVVVHEPYKFKVRTPERGKCWEEITSILNALDQPVFRVTSRSVRDRFALLNNKMSQKLREEQRASGIDPDEPTELEILLEDILEREREAKERLDAEDADKKKSAGKDKAAAEQVRKQALERMSSRKGSDSDEDTTPVKRKKARRSTANVMEFLSCKAEKEIEFKNEELEVRKKELDLASSKQDQHQKQQEGMMAVMINQMQQQQQQQQAVTSMLLQQQKMFMAFMDKKP